MVEGSRRSGFQLPIGEEGEALVTMRNISMIVAGPNIIFYDWPECHELV